MEDIEAICVQWKDCTVFEIRFCSDFPQISGQKLVVNVTSTVHDKTKVQWKISKLSVDVQWKDCVMELLRLAHAIIRIWVFENIFTIRHHIS